MAKERTPPQGGSGTAPPQSAAATPAAQLPAAQLSPAPEVQAPDQRVYELARDLFAQKVVVGACQSRVHAAVIEECFNEATAFVAAAAERGY